MQGYLEVSREPLRPVVADIAGLDACLDALASASGPIAIDAERAHGHRYWPKAYLFQVRRPGAGTWLIDPIPFEQHPGALARLTSVTPDATWIIHAASQDLPCMREVGIVPSRLFDTELAARLLGEPGVGLRALLEDRLDIRLRKAHSAANWSTRPLPEGWLIYAALDVDYLVELHDILHKDLETAGRLDWAEQEFRATLEQFRVAPDPPTEPWRRLSGVTTLRTPRQLAVARALWEERDAIARDRDRPPGRILPDTTIIALASKARDTAPDVQVLDRDPSMRTRSVRRYRPNWARALESAGSLSPAGLPAKRPPRVGPGHPKSWERHNPEAAAAWQAVKPAIDELGCELRIQPSLVAPPAAVQSVVFHHWAEASLGQRLLDAGLRPWQVEFMAPLLEEHLADLRS